MFGWFKKKPTVPSRETLVPRIKNLHFTAALRDMNIPADQLPLAVAAEMGECIAENYAMYRECFENPAEFTGDVEGI